MTLLRVCLALALADIASSFLSSPLHISKIGKRENWFCPLDQRRKAERDRGDQFVLQLHSSDNNSKSKAFVSQKLTTSLGLQIKQNSRKKQILQSYGAKSKSKGLMGVFDSLFSYLKGFLQRYYHLFITFLQKMRGGFLGEPNKIRKSGIPLQSTLIQVEEPLTDVSTEIPPPPDNTRVLQLIGGYAKRHSNETLADTMKAKSEFIQPKMSKYAGIGTTAWGKDAKDRRVKAEGDEEASNDKQLKSQGDEEDEDSKTRRLEKLMSAYASRYGGDKKKPK
uniref:Uncharacterized protein n=1 Tax=Hanusia phi TaxID=3032 RepID=A0A7S0HFS0_9CRYP|mmetsp:Transcript_16761/g.38238  ORF Transcript_16761/g.38238 Transcript_16761/m.38238 type:complete len:279 (+) Transcript_16761:54-890(+)